MRYFNTTGPCNPQEHFTVMREALIAKGQALVDQGRYFTIFAPRQAGKTTYFQLLLQKLKENKTYTPIWVSFEHLNTFTKEEFYQDLATQLSDELAKYNIELAEPVKNLAGLTSFFRKIKTWDKPLVLFIDEFEGIPDSVLSELMHTLRMIYHRREHHGLHAIILVGVSTIAELVVSSASPFNIVDELKIPYFTNTEVQDLIQQYVSEARQSFEQTVIKAIYENTQGQPGLVCALCGHLVEKMVTDRNKAVRMADFYPTLKYFLTERFDKNIINIVHKAREKRDFMIRLLFSDESIPFTVNDPDIAYLFAHGVVDNLNGYVGIPVPLYSKVLITAFRPLINGETDHYFVSPHETFSDYLIEGELNMKAILTKYQEYVQRRGFRAFNTDQLKEAAWHYSLDGFINFFIEALEGQTFVEVPTGRGRTDILILHGGKRYIIETKIFANIYRFQKGKGQLVAYLKSEGLAEGYYVVFSNKHTETDTLYFTEEIEGKLIYTYIIRTNFKQPSV